MDAKECRVFVDGKECGRPLTLVDLEGKKNRIPQHVATR